VRGDALSLVVIDKLPFAPPDDPVLAARLDSLAREGGNPFLDYQLPQAVISLKQGAGRLIRDETDRGGSSSVIAGSFRSRTVGESSRALPPMKLVRELDKVLRLSPPVRNRSERRLRQRPADPKSAAELGERVFRLRAVGKIFPQDPLGVVAQLGHAEHVVGLDHDEERLFLRRA